MPEAGSIRFRRVSAGVHHLVIYIYIHTYIHTYTHILPVRAYRLPAHFAVLSACKGLLFPVLRGRGGGEKAAYRLWGKSAGGPEAGYYVS